ncbi:LOW QUALITY PROTEIN: uncharacterized protein [Mobula birostris]|uniref:LOW QUALITY PROTEIN: uncharacterized protein n=1 Tax=Mobula birostris TaxID=1983395 RepID=UPI003B28241D
MASKGQIESWTEEAICPICLDFFTDPVILDCGHNFCRSCITRCWEREERNSCPECREEIADRTLRVNRALANLSEKARKLNLNPKEKESKLHCKKHEEELKLFCETDKTLICLICRDGREHKSHNFMPVNEAVEIYKDRVKSFLDSLTKKKSDFEEMEQQQKEKISGVREQSQSVQSQITSHFAEMHRIITEKEQRALRDLREEEKWILNLMEKNLREIQENLNSIQEEISKLQKQMDQQENITFLMEEAHRKRRFSNEEQTLSVTDGALLVEKFCHPYLFDIALGEAFDGIKRVFTHTILIWIQLLLLISVSTAISRLSNLEERSWLETSTVHLPEHMLLDLLRSSRILCVLIRKNPLSTSRKNLRNMLIVHHCSLSKPQKRVLSATRLCLSLPAIPGDSLILCFSPPVSVTLDVETVHRWLEVSEDRKSVRCTGNLNFADTRKRFTYWTCALGSEGFTMGRHYWEVEVTGNRLWSLGVAAESVERKRPVTQRPGNGFWIIGRIDDEIWIHTSPLSCFLANPIPERVGVYLSYESGTVSFYNSETKSHLHTFTGNKFTEKLYPFFGPSHVNQWLRICSRSTPAQRRVRAASRQRPTDAAPSRLPMRCDCPAAPGPYSTAVRGRSTGEQVPPVRFHQSFCGTAAPLVADPCCGNEHDSCSLKRNIHSRDCSAPSGQSRYHKVQQLPESERILNQEVPRVNMASKAQVESLTEEVICPICLDFFTDPVILECGHNFCRSCITRYWERKERNSCPECREEIADRTLRVNRALANLSEKARKLNLNPKEKESKLHCEKHEEELKLFCETDKTLICLICATAREHKSHNLMPVNEAVEIYKGRVKSSLDSLTKKKSDFEEMEQQQKEKISGVLEQSHSLQSQITSHFAELRRVLTEKEQRALRNLREEEERILNPMEKSLREIQGNLNSTQEEISKLQERMDRQENITFLMEEARRKRRISNEEQTLSVTDGALLVEKFYHPYLFDIALGEALDSIKRVSVTLDVETASPRLEVSEDRKSVRATGTRRDLPDTGKRFTVGFCVLGSEGFTSGRHYWEVEVTGNRCWSLGVAAESVERKGWVTLSPETGFWIFGRFGDVMKVHTSPRSRLPAGPIPRRVGVYLRYESGTVSFYNAETKSHLHTFTGNKFTEKLYPFFWTVYTNEWLRICSGSAPGLWMGRIRDRRQEKVSVNINVRRLK